MMAESRRVAQLLSALPAEYDVEGMLASTLAVRGSAGFAGAQGQLEAAARAKEAARAATTASQRKIRGLLS
jgi:ribosomal protein L12E/L44/L45/RPP1/RPP2